MIQQLYATGQAANLVVIDDNSYDESTDTHAQLVGDKKGMFFKGPSLSLNLLISENVFCFVANSGLRSFNLFVNIEIKEGLHCYHKLVRQNYMGTTLCLANYSWANLKNHAQPQHNFITLTLSNQKL